MSLPPDVPEPDGVPNHRQQEVQLPAPLLSLGLLPALGSRLHGDQVGPLGVLKYVFELKCQAEVRCAGSSGAVCWSPRCSHLGLH